MSDPLGRKHQTVKIPHNRSQINRVCDYVLENCRKDFLKKPSVNHIYYDAYFLIFGSTAAVEMLQKARG